MRKLVLASLLVSTAIMADYSSQRGSSEDFLSSYEFAKDVAEENCFAKISAFCRRNALGGSLVDKRAAVTSVETKVDQYAGQKQYKVEISCGAYCPSKRDY